MRVVVTGAAGYVGSRLAGVLAAGGVDVVAVVRRRREWLACPQVELDLTSGASDRLAAQLAGADAVVHLAGANESVAAADPERALSSTVAAAMRLAMAAAAAMVRRVVHLSTVHVYGAAATPGATITEEARPQPRHPYAIARLASEHILDPATTGRAGDTVILRLANGVGAPAHPGVDRWTLVANDLCRQGVTGGRLTLRSTGAEYRDFIDLGDACRIIAAAADPGGDVPAGTYNVASGRPMAVGDLASTVQDVIERILGARPPLRSASTAGGPEGGPPVVFDTSRLAAIGLGPTTPVEASIDETVRFCIMHAGELHRV